MFVNTDHYYTPVDNDEDIFDGSRTRLLLGSLPDRAVVGLPTRISAFVVDFYVEEQSDSATASAAFTLPRSRRKHWQRSEKTPLMSAGGSTAEVYQSITCTQGIGDKSFEELRLECYRQSMVATGRPPQPVHRRIVIPPAFTPLHVQEQGFPSTGKLKDVIMSAEPLLACAFTFSASPSHEAHTSGVIDEISSDSPRVMVGY